MTSQQKENAPGQMTNRERERRLEVTRDILSIKPEDLVGLKVTAHIGIREYEGKEYNHIEYFCDPVPRPLGDLLLSNIFGWLKENPCPQDDGRHQWCFDAARQCKFYRLPPEWAVRMIRALLTRNPRGREVEHAVQSAYNTGVQCVGPNGETLEKEDVEPYGPAKLAVWSDLIEEEPDRGWEEWLIERSPVSLDVEPWRIPSLFFDHAYSTGDLIWCGRHDADQGDFYQPGDERCAMNLWKYLERSQKGGKFLINPTNGNGRSGEHVIRMEYVLVESDEAPFGKWLKMLIQLRKPIVAIYKSGRRSIHTLIHVDARNEFEYKLKARELRELLIPLGADENSTANKVVQLSRIPGVMRHETGQMQQLLWLDPNADGTPIYTRNDLGF